MLYIFDKINLLDDDFPERNASLLSEERKTKFRRLRSSENKKASVSVYLLLRLALLKEFGITDIVEFSYAKNRKPFLRNFPKIHFNLSHSQDVAACVISDVEVGVDVQQIRNVKENVAKRVLTDKEFDEYKSAQSQNEYFCKIWTIKESFLKWSGQGITTELRDIEAETLTDIETFRGENYFCSVCGVVLKETQLKYIGREDFEQLII